MDKLIQLLNEYDKINKHHNNWFRNEYGHLDRTYGWSTVSSSCWKVISKEYGFIKWLVDNDKIDTSYKKHGENRPYKLHQFSGKAEKYSPYDTILMLLAISNEPINDLISYLK